MPAGRAFFVVRGSDLRRVIQFFLPLVTCAGGLSGGNRMQKEFLGLGMGWFKSTPARQKANASFLQI
jgi:CO dehydrogenase/acetyl-CoA synthase beta subunit